MGIVSFASCKDDSRLPTTELTILRSDGSKVFVEAEIADTEETRNRGFMEREEIPDGTGMVFIFDRDQILGFWMKNTPHPLSIAYIDSTGLNYFVGPTETSIEGDYNKLMEIIRECQLVAAKAGAESIASYVKINYRPDGEVLTIERKVAKHHK